MKKPTNIMLVGFMGTGKTTVGRIVAEKLNKSFVDMDEVIEQQAGKAISRIFADDGESHFRSLERQLVQELAAQENLVVAAGGGVVLDHRNIDDFNETGNTVCLLADPHTILGRVEKESHRPLLEGGDKAQKILGILESRRELYMAVPHKVDTTDLKPEQVVAEVIAIFSAAGGV